VYLVTEVGLSPVYGGRSLSVVMVPLNDVKNLVKEKIAYMKVFDWPAELAMGKNEGALTTGAAIYVP